MCMFSYISRIRAHVHPYVCTLLIIMPLLVYIDCLMKRLKDTDAEVRLASMTALSHILLDSPLKLKCETVVQMVDRVKDRNTELRKFATETVGKAYYKHISSVHVHPHLHTGISMDQLVSKIPEELWLRLSNVPSHIVNCWGFPEIEFKLHILKVS